MGEYFGTTRIEELCFKWIASLKDRDTNQWFPLHNFWSPTRIAKSSRVSAAQMLSCVPFSWPLFRTKPKKNSSSKLQRADRPYSNGINRNRELLPDGLIADTLLILCPLRTVCSPLPDHSRCVADTRHMWNSFVLMPSDSANASCCTTQNNERRVQKPRVTRHCNDTWADS